MMTKKEAYLLAGILADMKKAKRYIFRNDIHFCMTTNCPNSRSYLNREGAVLDSMNKHIGSELCYLYNAIDRLELMINPPKDATND